MSIADDVTRQLSSDAVALIMEGTNQPQYLGGGRWVWSREALEAEITFAVENFRRRLIREIEQEENVPYCVYDLPARAPEVET